jgi:hypothetical protein
MFEEDLRPVPGQVWGRAEASTWTCLGKSWGQYLDMFGEELRPLPGHVREELGQYLDMCGAELWLIPEHVWEELGPVPRHVWCRAVANT